jgi:sugar/nucleoside kinase (ribokinase family)
MTVALHAVAAAAAAAAVAVAAAKVNKQGDTPARAGRQETRTRLNR